MLSWKDTSTDCGVSMEDRTSKQTEDKEPSLGLPPLGYTSNLAFFHLHTKCRILRIYYSEELRKWLLYQKEVTTKWHVDNFLKKSCNAGVKCFFFLFDCHVILIFTSSKKSFLISFVVVFYVRYTWRYMLCQAWQWHQNDIADRSLIALISSLTSYQKCVF